MAAEGSAGRASHGPVSPFEAAEYMSCPDQIFQSQHAIERAAVGVSPQYLAADRELEQAVEIACGMTLSLHALIGAQSLRGPVQRFASTDAAGGVATETMLRRLKTLLRGYGLRHEVEATDLVRIAIQSYYGR